MTVADPPLSPAAARMRRCRARKKAGVVLFDIELSPGGVANLIRFGWLDPARRNKAAIQDALIALANRALGTGLRPW